MFPVEFHNCIIFIFIWINIFIFHLLLFLAPYGCVRWWVLKRWDGVLKVVVLRVRKIS